MMAAKPLNPQHALECRRMGFQRRGGGWIFDGLEACFDAGRMTLVTGPTGAGKTTLLHLLGGLLSPTAGTILAAGQPVSRWRVAHKDRWRRQVGLVFQHLHLIPELSVMENVVLPLIPIHRNWRGCMARAAAVLDPFDLTPLAHMPVAKLSGGQRQKVAVARAMIHEPHYLLLDEPSAFQDNANTDHLLGILSGATARGACVVVCSHDPRLTAGDRFDHCYRLDHGRLQGAADYRP